MYQLPSFFHVGALETGYDGNVDGLFTDCVNETLGNRIAADNATFLSES
jgi:hypothetical protein